MDAKRRHVAGAALLVSCLAAIWRLNGRRINGMATAALRGVEIAKGPPHGTDI